MAKKKKAKKKVHRQRSAQSNRAAATPTVMTAGSPAVAPSAPSADLPSKDATWRSQAIHLRGQAADGATLPSVDAPRWSYVGTDVRRIGVLAGSCVVAELVLWYLFNHTGLGTAVYGLIT